MKTDVMDERSEYKAPTVDRSRTWMALGAVVMVGAGVWYWWHSRGYESTDNATLESAVVQVSARVPGQVLRVHVEDNQRVKKGDLLVELDPRDYEAKLEEARARLADTEARLGGAESGWKAASITSGAQLQQAGAGVGASREQVQMLEARLKLDEAGVEAAQAAQRQTEARRVAAQAEAERAQADAERYRALFKKDEISRQMLDRAETDAKAAQANLEAARQMVAASGAQAQQAQAGLSATRASLRQGQRQTQVAEGRAKEAEAGPQMVRAREAEVAGIKASIEQLKAQVKQAELALSYTQVTASEDGVITRKSVEPGNYVQPGQALAALVGERFWVVANFKETQLERMRPGQEVRIKVDAYPQHKLSGKVESIQRGTGARFSLLPAENATGNFVKVVQRVPVKIVLTSEAPAGVQLGAGMSVEPEVELR